MPFLLLNQQRQSTEGTKITIFGKTNLKYNYDNNRFTAIIQVNLR